MFCPKCGKELEEGMRFCSQCGRNIVEGNDNKYKDTSSNESKKHRRVGIAVVAIGVIVVLLLLNGGNKPEKIVKKYYKAIQNIDVNLYYSILAEDYKKYMVGAGSWYSTEKEFKEDLKDSLEEWKKGYENICGKNVRLSVKVTDVKHFSKQEVQNFSDTLAQDYEFKSKVSDVVELSYTMTFRGNEGNHTEKYNGLYVIKIRGKWYLQVGYVGDSWKN